MATNIVVHRINTVDALRSVPRTFGTEIDVRGYGDRLLLSHDPIRPGADYDRLEDYLAAYRHGTLVLNLKEAGYEQRVLDLVHEHGLRDFFLLDVEFPYLYRATRELGIRDIAVRFSEAEPIEAVLAQTREDQPLLNWVWIDTNTRLPLNPDVVEKLKPFRTCLVCPERWGRPQDIPVYRRQMAALNFEPSAVMTSAACAPLWAD